MTSRLGAARPLRARGRLAAVAAAIAHTWSSVNKPALVALTNGNLTATRQAGGGITYGSGYGTVARSAGKTYFEVLAAALVSTTGNFAVGVLPFGMLTTTYLGGEEANSVGYYANGQVWQGDAVVATLATYTALDRIGVYMDHVNGRGWFTKNGVLASGDPVAGTGAHFTFTPATAMFAGYTTHNENGAGDSLTVNFGATAFAVTPLTGYSAWNA